MYCEKCKASRPPCKCHKEEQEASPVERGVIKPCPFCGEQPEEDKVCAQRHMETFLVETAECKTKNCPMEGLKVCLEGWQQRAV